MSRLRLASSIGCVCALLAVTAGQATAATAPPKSRPAPSGKAFYRPPSPLPAGKAGDVIWSRRITSLHPKAETTYLVLYRSTGAFGHAAAVSGTVVIPRGRAPKGGWPIVSWAHGTTGIADVCAPSLTASNTTSPIQQTVDAWVAKGYAVARTDYAGLGTPGTHPYLVGVPEGDNVIDIVRAARQLDPHLQRNWVSAGHSEGGQAALFAAAQADHYAPELRLRGVAAFAPASHSGDEARLVNTLTQPSPLTGYAALILEGIAAGAKGIDVAALESPAALALRPQVEQSCLQDLEKPTSFGALAPAQLLRPGVDLTAVERALDAQNPGLAIPVPVRLYQGDVDTTVPRVLTDELHKELVAKHDDTTYQVLPGVDHGTVVAKAEQPFLSWLRGRLG